MSNKEESLIKILRDVLGHSWENAFADTMVISVDAMVDYFEVVPIAEDSVREFCRVFSIDYWRWCPTSI